MKQPNHSRTAEQATAGQHSRISASIQSGWQSARANLIPGLVVVFLAALIVLAYYQLPAFNNAMQSLVNLRERWGVWFSMLASATSAGLIPALFLMASGRARRGLPGLVDLLFTCLVWAVAGFAVDRFYTFQAWLWGATVSIPLVLAKMMLDQFVFTPIVGIQIPTIGFRLRDMGYNLGALWKLMRQDWLVGVTLPMLVACWLTWIPGTLVIYSLPLALQIPMMVLIQFFFALEMAYLSSRM